MPDAPATELPQAVEPAASVQPEQSGGFFRADDRMAETNGGNDGYGDDPYASEPAYQSSANMVTWTTSGQDLQGYSATWRYKLSLGGLVAGGLVYLVTRDVFPSAAIAVAGVVFGFLGSRTPAPISYQVDQRGITVGQKRYPYNDFRSFSVVEEGLPTIMLAPLRRFMPMLAIRFDTQQADDIIGLLAQHLPMEAHRRDSIDRLVGRIKI